MVVAVAMVAASPAAAVMVAATVTDPSASHQLRVEIEAAELSGSAAFFIHRPRILSRLDQGALTETALPS
jgi:hypothetical protein